MAEVKKSKLTGIGGWLTFWLVVFSLSGMGYIILFFSAIESDLASATTITTLISSPVLAVGFILSTVLIALRKRLGQTVTLITLVASAVSSIALTLSEDITSLAGTAALIMTALVAHGLIGLYFVVSQRVKATLVEN